MNPATLVAAPADTTLMRSLFSIGFLARFSYALARNPVLPLFAVALGAGPEGIGLAVGISTVTGILFKMPSGALSDVIGRRRTMLAGLVVFGLMPFAYLFITDYAALVVIRFLHGLATAIYGPVAMAVVADIAGARKGEMLSWFSSVGIAGTLLGAPIGGYLLFLLGDAQAGLSSYRAVFLCSALTGAAALVLGFLTLRNGDKPAEGKNLAERFHLFAQGIREVVADRRVLMTSSMEGIQNMSMGALEAFLPVYAVAVAGLNVFQAGLIWGGADRGDPDRQTADGEGVRPLGPQAADRGRYAALRRALCPHSASHRLCRPDDRRYGLWFG